MHEDENGNENDRVFRVRARHEDAQHGRLVHEASFEAAALSYAEHLPYVADRHEIGVVVRDLQTGHEHSYLLHFDPGEPPSIT